MSISPTSELALMNPSADNNNSITNNDSPTLAPSAMPTSSPSAQPPEHYHNPRETQRQIQQIQIQQQQQQTPQTVIYDWKETPFDPNDKRPFVRKPTGSLITPFNSLAGIKFVLPIVWLWMIPAILIPLCGFLICVPAAEEVWSRVIAILIAACSYTIFFLGNFSDPGIVLPARVGDPPAQSVMIHIDQVGDVQLEVCRTCKILRPPRSSHCRSSDVCVRDYDHYCGVLNHVVGQRTFRWFTHFMWVTACLVFFVAGRSIYAAAKEYDYDKMFGSDWGRFRLFSTFLLLAFLCLATCWLGAAGPIYCCYFGGTALTLKDLKGRKSFVKTDEATWHIKNIWYRLFSCDEEHYPASPLHDDMTWIEEDKKTGKIKLVGVKGVIQEDYNPDGGEVVV